MGRALGIGWTTVVPEKMSENLLKIGKFLVKAGVLETGSKYEILLHGLQLTINEARGLIKHAEQSPVENSSPSGSGRGQSSIGDTGDAGRPTIIVPEVKEGEQNG